MVENFKNRRELEAMFQGNKVVLVADSKIHSHTQLPYVDFVKMNLRLSKDNIRGKDKEKTFIGKLGLLSTVELH